MRREIALRLGAKYVRTGKNLLLEPNPHIASLMEGEGENAVIKPVQIGQRAEKRPLKSRRSLLVAQSGPRLGCLLTYKTPGASDSA